PLQARHPVGTVACELAGDGAGRQVRAGDRERRRTRLLAAVHVRTSASNQYQSENSRGWAHARPRVVVEAAFWPANGLHRLPSRGWFSVIARGWRDLPERFGPWQTVWKRAEADAAGRVDWSVSVDSSIVRAHQHWATAKRVVREDRAQL